jgi:hypothetical protein
MSISATSGTGSSQYQLGATNNLFQRLSQDLKAGNLASARSDFASLQKAFLRPTTTSASTSNPIAQAFHQFATDLMSGDLAAAQKDFSAIQQDIQNLGGLSTKHFHHYRPLSTGTEDLANQNSLLQDLSQLGQSLASGNLAAAQKTYAALQAQASVSTVSNLHQTSPPALGRPIPDNGLHHTSPPVFPPVLGRPVPNVNGLYQAEPPILAMPVSLVA